MNTDSRELSGSRVVGECSVRGIREKGLHEGWHSAHAPGGGMAFLN